MIIDHYSMTYRNIDHSLFDRLIKDKLYTKTGQFKDIYRSPSDYILGDTFVSTFKLEKDSSIIGVLFLSEANYAGWEYIDPNLGLENTYGTIGFYTRPAYRKKGVARKLFEDFDSRHTIRKLSCFSQCSKILKTVDPSDLVLIQHDLYNILPGKR